MVAAVLEQQSDKREDERHSTEGPNAKTRDEDRPENGESRQPSELDDIREQPNRQGDSEPTHPQPGGRPSVYMVWVGHSIHYWVPCYFVMVVSLLMSFDQVEFW